MKRYSEFIVEGIKDKMTPKSEEDIRRMFSEMTPEQKLERGAANGIMWVVKDGLEELGGKKYSLKVAINNAAQNNHVDIVEYLIDNGEMSLKDIDQIKDVINDTPYMPGFYDEFKKKMRTKLNSKRLVILKGENDYTGQLSHACQHNEYKLAEEAIEKGADVKDTQGRFMWNAVGTGNERLVRLLLENGVPPESGNSGITVGANQNVEKATCVGNVEVVKLLLQYGSKIRTGRYSLLNNRIKEWVEKDTNHEMIVFLLENYPDFNDVLEEELSKLDTKMKLYQKYVK